MLDHIWHTFDDILKNGWCGTVSKHTIMQFIFAVERTKKTKKNQTFPLKSRTQND